MTQPAKKYYTPEEYFALEEKAEYKSEYYYGEIFPMIEGAPRPGQLFDISKMALNRSRITLNIASGLNQAFEGKAFEAFSGGLQVITDREGKYVTPDVIVVGGEVQFVEGRDDVVSNPLVIIEVSSGSFMLKEQWNIRYYHKIATLQEYLLIDLSEISIEHYQKRTDSSWLVSFYQDLEQMVKFQSLEIEMPPGWIYKRVEFPKF